MRIGIKKNMDVVLSPESGSEKIAIAALLSVIHCGGIMNIIPEYGRPVTVNRNVTGAPVAESATGQARLENYLQMLAAAEEPDHA